MVRWNETTLAAIIASMQCCISATVDVGFESR
jgi:hypothetical protein